MPLQFSKFGKIPLLFTYYEERHYNSSSFWKMPRYTCLVTLGPTAASGEYKYFRIDNIALRYFPHSTHWRVGSIRHPFYISPTNVGFLPRLLTASLTRNSRLLAAEAPARSTVAAARGHRRARTPGNKLCMPAVLHSAQHPQQCHGC